MGFEVDDFTARLKAEYARLFPEDKRGDEEAFASLLGEDRGAVWRYLRKQRKPSYSKAMALIAKAQSLRKTDQQTQAEPLPPIVAEDPTDLLIQQSTRLGHKTAPRPAAGMLYSRPSGYATCRTAADIKARAEKDALIRHSLLHRILTSERYAGDLSGVTGEHVDVLRKLFEQDGDCQSVYEWFAMLRLLTWQDSMHQSG